MPSSTYRIEIDGDWTLEDLYTFPRTYSQLYSVLFVLDETNLSDVDEERAERTFQAHPWRGGYSAVNFYGWLGYLVPRRDRPRIASIRYASPGWIELALAVGVAANLGRLVSTFVKAGHELNGLYSEIYKGLNDRKLMKVNAKREELDLRQDEVRFLEDATQRLSRLMGFPNVAAIHRLTGNPLATIKILLSIYRRLRKLAAYEEAGKAKF